MNEFLFAFWMIVIWQINRFNLDYCLHININKWTYTQHIKYGRCLDYFYNVFMNFVKLQSFDYVEFQQKNLSGSTNNCVSKMNKRFMDLKWNEGK